VLAVTGRHEEAITQLKRAHRVDPLAPDVMVTLTQVLTSAGRYDEAVSYSQQLRDKQWLARVRLVQGKFDETIALLSNHPGLAANPQMRGFLGHAYARAGRRTEAESMAAASRFPNERALIFAGLGDKERTIEALEGMTILGAQRLGLYLHYPEMALLKGDPRLQELRKKVGLPL
jgi:predicted Zn-dependent protease